MSRGLTIYNQTVLSDDDFVLNFVARHNVLETLLRCLRAADESGGQHHLLVGPRGMGKTSMLRRLAIGIDRDEELFNTYIPLSFREEQYNVLKLGDFWRNCGEALAEWAEGKGWTEIAHTLDHDLAGPDWNDDRAGDSFERALAGLERRAVLLVDNLDLILDNLSDEDNWKLRRALQRRGGPIIVGAATQLLKQTGDREAAFYEFFQPHYLEPLDADETESCMRALARARGSTGAHVVQVLDTQPERLRTLHTLTGGNPRVLALIYRLLESAESDAAMADLELLLDQVTPYYKARVEEYQGAQQRAVIDAIALHWDPITTSELSSITNIASTTLSPLLIRLRKDGLIENVGTSGSYAAHQLIERFFNIWYLMRHGTRRAKQKMRWLVAFLTSFYSNHELEDILKRARLCGDALKWHADYSIAFEEALSRSALIKDAAALQIPSQAEPNDDPELAEAFEVLARANEAFEADDLETAHTLYSSLLDDFNKPDTPLPDQICAVATLGLAGIAVLNDDLPDAMRCYGDLLDRYQDGTDSKVQRAILGAMLGRAVVFSRLEQADAALLDLQALIDRSDEAEAVGVSTLLDHALRMRGLILAERGDHSAALHAFKAVAKRLRGKQDIESLDMAAASLLAAAECHKAVDDREAEIATHDEVAQLIGNRPEPVLRAHLARSLLSKGRALGKLGEDSLELDTYEELIARFDGAEEKDIQENVAHALLAESKLHIEAGRNQDAFKILDIAISKFSDADEPKLRTVALVALFGRAAIIDQAEGEVAALPAYDEFIEQAQRETTVGRAPAEPLVAVALARRGAIFASMGDEKEAIRNFNEVISNFGSFSDAMTVRTLLSALDSVGDIYRISGRIAEAISCYEKASAISLAVSDVDLAERQSNIRVRLAKLLLDHQGDAARAEKHLVSAQSAQPTLAKVNLLWLYLLTNRLTDAVRLRDAGIELPLDTRELLDAGMELSRGNIGLATEHLGLALQRWLVASEVHFESDLDRLLRLANQLGHGEPLIAWFEASGYADRFAPLVTAFKALVRGGKVLLDVNPEVRGPAKAIFARLEAPQRNASVTTTKGKSGRRSKVRRTDDRQ